MMCQSLSCPTLGAQWLFRLLSVPSPRELYGLSEALQGQRERLLERLAEQINSLPVGNESWLQTERELVAAERALHQLDGRCQLVI